MMGFNDTERFRSPNLLVKHRMMRALGWTYDADEKSAPFEQPIKTKWDL
jgi:hypothetical protein